ncbi:unnamed protein product [Linum tenue]|uniref:Uncharacterized protein n=1 Tax=Linum tenue TaxID=586396 RepID=A0AAV0N0R0_9ROSI|nr:unnamed protein product [Linum tenue]
MTSAHTKHIEIRQRLLWLHIHPSLCSTPSFIIHSVQPIMDLHHQSNPVKTKQLHSFQVSPPAGSLDPSAASLPITFFDVMWLNSRPMRRLFFYDFPYPTLHFTQSILPLLRRSLSLALHRFFPLAGSLVVPPPPQLPFLCFSPASDSVPLTIAEAESDVDYDGLVGNQPRDVRELHPLVPEMNPGKVRSEDGARLSPLLAVQVTVFPNRGLCIGVQFHHVAADGMAFHGFMKLWAALLRSAATGGDAGACDQLSLPADHLQHRGN